MLVRVGIYIQIEYKGITNVRAKQHNIKGKELYNYQGSNTAKHTDTNNTAGKQ